MGFNYVYRSLVEVFPQVDVRILKAVAIEHSKDADAAVEFILTEVLPSMHMQQESVASASEYERADDIPVLAVEAEKLSLIPEHPELVEGNGAHSTKSNCPNDQEGGNMLLNVQGRDDRNFENGENRSEEVITSALSERSDVEATTEKQLSVVQPSASDDPTEAHVSGLEQLASDGSGSTLYEQTTCTSANLMEVNSLPKIQLSQSAVESELLASAELGVAHENSDISSLNVLQSSGFSGEDVDQSIVDAGVVEVDDGSDHADSVAHSSQTTVAVDFLDEFVTDAKTYKKSLTSAMESVMRMVREVELQENAASQAKEEACKGSATVLAKVEELKKMLQHAKAANDMHAGEVYGEKSILATEARELQSRLLNLSDQRDQSLSTIHEIHQKLEARLAAAEAEKAMAEQEKHQNEELANKAFSEQESIMGMVVEESKILQEEGEENAKLQEFLIDRGRVVDQLQGEIAVICEDVKLLKERVDARLPVGRGLSSSTMSGSSVSSTATRKTGSLHEFVDASKTLENLQTSSEALSNSGASVRSNDSMVELANGGGQKRAASEDDWYMFDEDYQHSARLNVVSGNIISA